MIDLKLLQKIKEAIGKRNRKYVTAADVLACVSKESGGVPIFHANDKLLAANLRAAEKITGISQDQIKQTMIIQSGPYQGEIAKFRAEPGYWKWAQNYKSAFKNTDLLLLSCSFGLGQKMTRWYVAGVPVGEWIPNIKGFMGNVPLQLLYCAGDLDALMVQSKGDKALAFTRYNAGPAANKNYPAYKAYGLPVYEKSLLLQKEIEELEK